MCGSAEMTGVEITISTAIVRQAVAVRFLIREVWQRIFGMGTKNACPRMEDPPVVVQTRYHTDLDPLDRALRHLLLTLLNPNAKDPSAWCLRGLIGCDIRGMSEYSLR